MNARVVRRTLAAPLLALALSVAPVRAIPPTPVPVPDHGSLLLLKRIDAYNRQAASAELIVGGEEVEIADFPWQVALLFAGIPANDKAQFCGGTLIDPYWVVTAAHCVDRGTTASQLHVLVGTDDLKSGGSRIPLQRDPIVHPGWQPATNLNDIALLRLASAAPMSPLRVLEAPAESAALGEASAATISGWGRIREGGPSSQKLLAVTVPVVPRDVCNGVESYGGAVLDTMFCAGLEAGGQDSCQGDSGGPLTVGEGPAKRLAGVVSWGEGCAQPKKYGVYTRAALFHDWIQAERAGAEAP